MNRRLIAWMLTGAMCLSLTACSGNVSPEAEGAPTLPEPSEEAARMIQGESITAEPTSVALCFVSGDGNSFSTVNREVRPSSTESLCEAAMRTLLYDSATPERQNSIPAGTQLLSLEFAGGMATVNLSLEAYGAQEDQDLLKLISAVSNTLLSLESVQGVNVLIAGRSESVASLPSGVRTQPYSAITPTYAQLSAEHEFFLESETESIQRYAAIYFPCEGQWLVPELRFVSFDSGNYASALIRELRAGPVALTCAESALPESADLLTDNPSIRVVSSGERVLEMNFSATLLNYLAFSGLEEWELLGSIVLTMTSFVPEIDAVRVNVDGSPITQCEMNGQAFYFSDGLMRRSDFVHKIGDVTTLYLPNEDGTLRTLERAGAMVRAQSPQSALLKLFESMNQSMPDAFPEGLSMDDLLGVCVEENVASINLSADFYRQAQALDAAKERGVVYAIVNTLCEMDGISGVRFYIEGISAETLSGSIYLKGVLLPNPGAVVLKTDAVPEITATP